MRIHLVRHGRSAHVHDGSWFGWSNVGAYEDAYDAAGILDADEPTVELDRLVGDATLVAASDLPRAIASANRLAHGRVVEISPLLREIRLEPPRWVPFKLPIEIWDVFSHVQWSYRIATRAEHASVRRANDAVDWLIGHAASWSDVVAVTHGGFRRILDAQLVSRGWARQSRERSYANWSVWSYSEGKPRPRTASGATPVDGNSGHVL